MADAVKVPDCDIRQGRMALRLLLVSFPQAKDAIPSPPSLIAIGTAGAAARRCKGDKATFLVATAPIDTVVFYPTAAPEVPMHQRFFSFC
jgi:hypothetical protein